MSAGELTPGCKAIRNQTMMPLDEMHGDPGPTPTHRLLLRPQPAWDCHADQHAGHRHGQLAAGVFVPPGRAWSKPAILPI